MFPVVAQRSSRKPAGSAGAFDCIWRAAAPPCILAGLLALSLSAPVQARNADVDQQVAQAARLLLTDQAAREGLAKPRVEISAVGTRSPAACSEPVEVAPLDARYPARMRFAVSCEAEGWRQEYVVRAKMSAEVVVASTMVPAGRPLAADDLTLERRDISRTPDALSDLQQAASMSSRRPLRAGQVLQKQMLVAPTLVRRGEAVRIVAGSGAIKVSAAGEALESGQRDDVVRVRNASTGKVIRARVIDSATVEPV